MPDALVSAVLGESFDLIGANWIEADRAKAQKLWTAHTLTMEGEPQRSQSIAAGGEVSANASQGEMTSMKVGDVAVSFASRSAANAGGGASTGSTQAEYCRTSYGTRFYELMKRNITSVLVT